MSGPYDLQIAQLGRATSLEEIQAVVRTFPARANGSGGYLYSGVVDGMKAEHIALKLAAETGEPIINNTPRAQFLSDPSVDNAIRMKAAELLGKPGVVGDALKSAVDGFVFGDANAVANSARSVEGCLWGEASRDFAHSLSGDVKVVAAEARLDRVLAKVEVGAALENPNVTSLAGRPVAELKPLYAQGGTEAVLPRLQAPMIEAVQKGVFVTQADAAAPGRVKSVTVSREAAATLGADASHFPPAADLAARGIVPAPRTAPVPAAGAPAAGTVARAPAPAGTAVPGEAMPPPSPRAGAPVDAAAANRAGVTADAAAAGRAVPSADAAAAARATAASDASAAARSTVAADAATAARAGAPAEAAAAAGLKPGMLGRGMTVVAVAAVAYDFATTGHQVLQLQGQGNATGADSAKAHFIGRNVGGIGGGIATGFVFGAGYGLVAGSETGPGALITSAAGGVIGGIAGVWMGEKWANQKDIDRVYTQKDADGNEWSRDPKSAKATWTRVADTQQVSGVPAHGADPSFDRVRYVASETLANELNFKSANASYELGLANAAKPQDPYSQPPGRGDARSASSESNWRRDPTTHAWGREVVTAYIEHGMKASHGEVASPQRAAQLDQAAALVIAQNAANAPASIAARYQVAYNQFGWDHEGKVPPAIQAAASRTSTLQASDGDTYTRDANGGWTTPSMFGGPTAATGNLRDELEGMYRSQQAGLQGLAEVATAAAEHPTRPSPLSLRGMVAHAYSSAGVTRTEAQIDAATAAVEHTRARQLSNEGGLPFALVLAPDPKTGRRGPDSAIVTLMDDRKDGLLSESKMVPRATTSAAEIKAQIGASHGAPATTPAGPPAAPIAPAPASPLHAPVAPPPPAADGRLGANPARTEERADAAANALSQLPAADQAMFARIREGAPASVEDGHVMLAMHKAKQDGITDAGKVQDATLVGDRLLVIGTTPGFRVAVDVSHPAPPMLETAQQALASNQQREQALSVEAQQRERTHAGAALG